MAENKSPPGDEKSDTGLNLGDTLTIREVESWRPRLLEALKRERELLLDGSEIERVDGAGLQLLAALVKETEKRNKPFGWRGISEPLRRAAAQLGLGQMLRTGDPAGLD